ncbi:hypothetical protein CHELA1G11_11260 [Hyphomicrobiales bacterium]|nr:hypothetical protein CHELA1G11_11260 [Hyphomicrobiales bacterium]CAH1669012.1 hypothetical protein CHELA1G2_13049 [Hyphomicrobiales bacterium]
MADDIARVAKDNWKIRRWVVFIWLTFSAVLISFIVFTGTDTALNQQSVIALIASSTAIIGSYVFGAVWDDNGKRRLMAERDEPEDSEPRRWQRFKI